MNNRIKALRRTLGLSQEEFGRTIGIGKSAVSYLEAGKSRLTESNQILICEHWNVNRDWLLSGTGEMFRNGKSDLDEFFRRYELSDLERQIIQAYLSLKKESRQTLLRIVHEMAVHMEHRTSEPALKESNNTD